MSAPEDMLKAATSAMHNAYAPYSNFQVGVCLRSSSGELFNGCNVENSSYPVTQCAEMNAIGNMVCQNQRNISEILIISSGKNICSPCGACRQCLSEFSDPETIVHLCTLDGDYKNTTIAELLPLPFNKSALETL